MVEKKIDIKKTSSKKNEPERKRKSRITEYGIQMREKQKVKKDYGISEKQFRNYVLDAEKLSLHKKLSPSLLIFINLETRLDNIVFRMGLSKTRRMARQTVSHGHILVNNKKINIPSHKVRINDLISIREGSKNTKLFINTINKEKDFKVVDWIDLDINKNEAKIISLPKEIEAGYDFAKILEFYNK